MTTALLVVVLTGVALLGVCVVLTHDPLRQTVVNGLFGLFLALFFVVLRAPDVAILRARGVHRRLSHGAAGDHLPHRQGRP